LSRLVPCLPVPKIPVPSRKKIILLSRKIPSLFRYRTFCKFRNLQESIKSLTKYWNVGQKWVKVFFGKNRNWFNKFWTQIPKIRSLRQTIWSSGSRSSESSSDIGSTTDSEAVSAKEVPPADNHVTTDPENWANEALTAIHNVKPPTEAIMDEAVLENPPTPPPKSLTYRRRFFNGHTFVPKNLIIW